MRTSRSLITAALTVVFSALPALAPRARAADFLAIAWVDASPGNDEIFLKKSTDGGDTWIWRRMSFNSGSSTVPSLK